MTSAQRVLKIFAPAKINLYLHVTEKRADGYHNLDSLTVFADIGDIIQIEKAPAFSLDIDGPYANAFTAKDKDSSPDSNNLAARAAWALARAAQKNPEEVRISLTKNLPLGSGLGGGSSDAAAVLWGLMEWWEIPKQSVFAPRILTELGADVSVCMTCAPVRMSGTGDILEEAPAMPEIPVLLVYPSRPTKTKSVFQAFTGPYREKAAMPESFDNALQLADFLKQQSNDLTDTACGITPGISDALHAIDQQKGTLIARMSGSGSSCFGLYAHEENCLKAAENILREHPNWWVRAGHINRPQRY